MEENLLTAKELLEASTRLVPLATMPEKNVRIQRIGLAVIAAISDGIPDVSVLAGALEEGKGPGGRKQKDERVKAANMVEAIIEAGLVEPSVSLTAPGMPRPSSFERDDQLAIFNAILKFSKFTAEDGEEVLPL